MGILQDINRNMPKTEVFFYYANLLDYLRFILLFWALQYTDWRFCLLYGISYFLDVFDGMVARYFDQCSTLGYYLDMLCDRTSSIVCLHLCAQWILTDTTYIPSSIIFPTAVFLYVVALVVEIVAHAVVCYFAEVKKIHQKKMGHQYLIVRLYLDYKQILTYACFSFEFFLLGIILNGSNYLSRPTIFASISIVAFPGFMFRIIANLFRLLACTQIDLKSGH